MTKKGNVGRDDPIGLPFQLLVEGKDLRNFFMEFARRMNVGSKLEIRSFGGNEQLAGYILAFKDRAGFSEVVERVGIIRDAETNFAGAFSSVCGSLERANLPVPEHHGLFTRSSPSVGVMILPGEGEIGMFETLLCKSIVGCEVNVCIEEFFECVENRTNVRVTRRDKARAQVFLATRPKPQYSVGVAASKGYWDLDHEAFEGVRGFLTSLLSESS